MTIYELDTLKSSLKKYAVVFAIGVGTGIYFTSCSPSSNSSRNDRDTYSTTIESRTQETKYKSRLEQRLDTFDNYTR